MYILDQFTQATERQRFYGVHPAEVTDIADPHQQGRVRVRLPWSPDNNGGGYDVWARLALLMAGNNRGTWFIPDVGDEVLVAFECGDPRRPYVLGMLWNGQDAPPNTMDGAQNNYIKSIVSRNGIRIELDDSDAQETLTLRTPQQTIVINDGERAIEITDANGNTVKLDASGVTITAAAQVQVNAATVKVSAGLVTVDAGMSKFSGVVQADTVIATTIVGATYTPGAGNIW
ncbi:MAG: type IV secretion protein Rhs [Caldilinea sp. CFX5]|nr:type IV secretion protein Rhs [Caldilinea sp. CFX5]